MIRRGVALFLKRKGVVSGALIRRSKSERMELTLCVNGDDILWEYRCEYLGS